jgi:hypothetical protein
MWCDAHKKNKKEHGAERVIEWEDGGSWSDDCLLVGGWVTDGRRHAAVRNVECVWKNESLLVFKCMLDCTSNQVMSSRSEG